jgi:hypothetical protein
LYRLAQQLLARERGQPVEPAYLLRSSNQGGFPRLGFYLDDVPKRNVAYVDVHHRNQTGGRFGAVDQIFPHELWHVILRQLAGEAPPGGANQVHAIGVRTDPIVAFNEGVAEHAQVMAVDAPDALPETRGQKHKTDLLSHAYEETAKYGRALSSRWSIAPRHRIGFLLWFSPTEQVLRYHAVKTNLFAHEVRPASLLTKEDPYLAYLYENIIPGDARLPVKSAGRLLSTEGFVSTVMYRWATSPVLQARYRENDFYESFGVRQSEVDSVDNVYLKLLAAIATHKPHDLASLVRAYARVFPDEASSVESLLRETGVAIPPVPPPEIWLESRRLRTGTTLFDQYRAMPRPHTFDLNAASQVDMLAISGVTPELARALQQAAPFNSIDDVARVRGITPAVIDEIHLMVVDMRGSDASAIEHQASIALAQILRPMAFRAGCWLIVAAIAGAVCYRVVCRTRTVRLAVNGFAAAVLALTVAWVFVSAPWLIIASWRRCASRRRCGQGCGDSRLARPAASPAPGPPQLPAFLHLAAFVVVARRQLHRPPSR